MDVMYRNIAKKGYHLVWPAILWQTNQKKNFEPRTIRILADKEVYMTKIGLDRMGVRAVFRRSLVGRLVEPCLIDCIADAVSEVIEENNKKLWETLQEALKKRQ